MEEDLGLDVLSATLSPLEGGSGDAALSPQARNRRRANAATDPLPAGGAARTRASAAAAGAAAQAAAAATADDDPVVPLTADLHAPDPDPVGGGAAAPVPAASPPRAAVAANLRPRGRPSGQRRNGTVRPTGPRSLRAPGRVPIPTRPPRPPPGGAWDRGFSDPFMDDEITIEDVERSAPEPRPVRAGLALAPAPNIGPAAPRPAPTQPRPGARAPGPSRPIPTSTPGVGLLRASREAPPDDLFTTPAPTLKELHAITVPGLRVLFDDRRIAEITRPRGVQDDIKAAQHLKAQKTLETSGWAASGPDQDHHAVYYGCQVVFRTGMSPATLAHLFQWSVPFGLDTPGDVSKDPAWKSLLDTGATLFPQLEAEVHGCRFNGREFSMPTSLFSKIRTLAEAYFQLRATILQPLVTSPLLGDSPLEEQARSALRGFIDQARTLPAAWGHIENMIDLGALRTPGTDPAVAENAARVAVSRGFLTALLQGQTPGWGLAELVQAHVSHQPSVTLLHSTDLARLVLTSPAAAALAASLPGSTTSAPPTGGGPAPPPYHQAAMNGGNTPTLADARLGFHLGPHGARTHPLYFSGEYVPPLGWLPPPTTGPPPTTAPANSSGRHPRTATNSALSIPTARSLIARSSPFLAASPHPCDYCGTAGHAQYECPRRFADTYHRALPGFTTHGLPDPSAWSSGDLTASARTALAAFLTEFKIPAHRKFGVTAEHIRTGTAPPAQA